MFWRKQRRAIDGFHPLHQSLIWQRGLSASMRPADWEHLIAGLAGHSAAVRRRRWALPDRTTTVLVPLIRVLGEDMRPDGVLSIAADLRGPKAKGKVGPQVEVPVPPHQARQRRGLRMTPGVTRILESRALDPWLRLRAELRDGSVLEVQAADRVRFRRVSKVTPSGKHKTKHKTKVTHVLTVTRRLPPDAVTRQPATRPPSWVAVKMRPGRRTLIRATGKLRQKVNDKMAERILLLMTETFRWTPPGTARPQRRTS
jgi:hypothetical protein